MTLDRAKELRAKAVAHQRAAREAYAESAKAIRAAVAEHGIRPTARALGMNESLVHRIAHREEKS